MLRYAIHRTKKPNENYIIGSKLNPSDGKVVNKNIRFFENIKDIPQGSLLEQLRHEFNEKIKNPIEVLSGVDTAWSDVNKELYNKQIRKKRKNKNHQHHSPLVIFSTPRHVGPNLYDNGSYRVPIDPFITPGGYSTLLTSPPPPDSFDKGKAQSLLDNPSFIQSLVPTFRNPVPVNTIQALNFDEDDDDEDAVDDKYTTPKSSPSSKSPSQSRSTLRRNFTVNTTNRDRDRDRDREYYLNSPPRVNI
jgi:hypothetical protein